MKPMTTLYEPAYEPAVASHAAPIPTGQVLRGQYAGVYRSDKGKIKGLRLGSGEADYTIKLPKYLRPMLVRELSPGDFIQVWAYPEDDRWRAVNILPLSDGEAEALRQQWANLTPLAKAQPPTRLCLEVCTKGKCFKQGGRHLYNALQAAVEGNADLAHVSLKATGCMKACKHGPNLRLPSGQMLHQATPAEALTHLATRP